MLHNMKRADFVVPRPFEEKRRDTVYRPSVPTKVVGTLCEQLLLQVCADSFYCRYGLKFGNNPKIIFVTELSHFSGILL